MKEVIITNYIESSSSKPSSQCRKDHISLRPKPNQRTQKPLNRRARLLSYAQELRHANHNPPPSEFKTTKKSSHHKQQKKWRWTRRVRSSFHELFHRRNAQQSYERILTEEYSDGENVNCEKGCKWRKRTSKERKTSHFCVSMFAVIFTMGDYI
nr:uncharacterized protein LOC104216767 isoform X7 [Ipomoea batatas]